MNIVDKLYGIVEISDRCPYKFNNRLPHKVSDGLQYNGSWLKVVGDEAYIEMRGREQDGKRYIKFNYKENGFTDVRESLILHGYRYYHHLMELIEENLYKRED